MMGRHLKILDSSLTRPRSYYRGNRWGRPFCSERY
jgi:hypothetical protein